MRDIAICIFFIFFCTNFCLDLVYCSLGIILLNIASTFILVLMPQKVAEVSY